ncbi:hypothetical protein U9R62_07895 [Cylindrospermopsis raciborskii DSH]
MNIADNGSSHHRSSNGCSWGEVTGGTANRDSLPLTRTGYATST